MKKLCLIVFGLVLSAISAHGQIEDGSIAPDFTATDIYGNEWNLYEVLNDGKTVILDIFATWCSPCWEYHTSGALKNLYEKYGPSGSDEFMVFTIEGDPNTNIDCLFDNGNCNNTTFGDWTVEVDYPIFENSSISDLYQIINYPTLFHICPDRIVHEIGQLDTESLYQYSDICTSVTGQNNVSILSYDGFEGEFCQAITFTPSIEFQNLGLNTLSTLSVQLIFNGSVWQEKIWNGSLSSLQISSLQFDEITLTESGNLECHIISVNDQLDDDISNNVQVIPINLSDKISNENELIFEIKTDEYPEETYWEIVNESNQILYSGGNVSVKNGGAELGVLEQKNFLYSYSIALPQDACYFLMVYDAIGDGICCGAGNGYFTLKDTKGNIILDGGSFAGTFRTPFSLEGASIINHNAAILQSNLTDVTFCGEYEYQPSLLVQNLGTSPIKTIKFDISDENTLLDSQVWSGEIKPAETQMIEISPISIKKSSLVTLSLSEINNEIDAYNYLNSYSVDLDRNLILENELQLKLKLDQYAYEIYWQLTDSEGGIIASGGNKVTGADGGGSGGASPIDEGAYLANTLVEEKIILPASVNDCYQLRLVDNFGDGLVEGGGGYLILSTNLGTDILHEDLNSLAFETLDYTLDADLAVQTSDVQFDLDVQIFPNPAKDVLNLELYLTENNDLEMELFDATGQVKLMKILESPNLEKHQHSLDISNLNNGLYFLQIKQGRFSSFHKFLKI